MAHLNQRVKYLQLNRLSYFTQVTVVNATEIYGAWRAGAVVEER